MSITIEEEMNTTVTSNDEDNDNDGVKSGTNKKRGYATRDLPVVADDDERYWSVSDAVRLLDPPGLDELWFRQLLHLVNMRPVAKKSGGSRRRHVRVYEAEKLAKAYTAVAEVIEVKDQLNDE
jgi:hypothetical protein